MRRPTKILHVTTASDRVSGAERLLIDIARVADRSRWDLAFLTLASEGVVNRSLKEHGWPVYSAELSTARDIVGGLARVLSVIRATRPDIIHTHLWHPAVLGAVIGRFTGARVVETRHYHDYYLIHQRRTRLLLSGWASRTMAGVASVSPASKTHLVQAERVPPQRVVVIENGVDTDHLGTFSKSEGRARLTEAGVSSGPILVCAAIFEERKGHRYLIEALSELTQAFPGVQLVLLGTGLLVDAVRAQARERGLSERVHFLGHREDVHSLIAGADVYIQPSTEEGFGLAVVEAMALHVPVVVSDVGGMKSTVEHDRTGLRVPPGDAAALARAIGSVLSDGDKARRLADTARASAASRYSIHRMVREYEAWYDRVLAER